MKLIVQKTESLNGTIIAPSSKSHTIRGIVIASLAKGKSILIAPLHSADTQAAIEGCKALGAKILQKEDKLIIEGFNGKPNPPINDIDTLNSGTSTNLLIGVISLGDFKAVISGDKSIQRRPVQNLLDALAKLGVKSKSLKNNGCPPIQLQGPLTGGKTEVLCRSSQYVSSLLLACPLAPNDTEIKVKNLCEKPYIQMTLDWLTEQGIQFQHKDYSSFKIKGNQSYKSFKKRIASDWSSAAFPLVAAAITKSNVLLKGLDINDSQGDKQIIKYLKRMGADIKVTDNGIKVKGDKLSGCALDLDDTPDALPAMAIAACHANGETIIKNVAHARIKETDRIKIMAEELSKMGARIKERPDGLVIHKSHLIGAKVSGHNDHRVVMALSLAGLIADGETEITTAEAINVTYPNYVQSMKSLGAKFEIG